VVRSGGRLAPVHTLPLTPAADEPGLRSASTVQPLAGLEYGPTPFSCPVDTLLTVLRHALTREERRQLRRCASQPGGAGRGGEAGEGCGTGGEGQTARSGCPTARRAGEGGAGESVEASRAVQTSKAAWKAVIEALRLWRGDPSRAAAAKVLWYECMRSQQAQQGGRQPPNGKAALGDCRCRCRCPCAECSSGRCAFCPSCGCKVRRLMGHCFGLAEQFFEHLLPADLPSSPFHLTTRPAWACTACEYTVASPRRVLHLPLLLSSDDVGELLAAGVTPEVGALAAAHLAGSPYDYGPCPRCGCGRLRARASSPAFSPLLLVELGRPGASAGAEAGNRVPWTLRVEPRMELQLQGGSQAYAVAAVVYNDGAHWWADLLSRRHFTKRSRSTGSYRYDGLESGGQLRYAGRGPSPTLTSEPRHVSLVWYRAVPDE